MLEEARRRGFLGPGAVEPHIVHARAFLLRGEAMGAHRCLDLGSGGGIPGLVLAIEHPATSWVLLDAGTTRSAFLARACAELGLAERVQVVAARAEDLGHDQAYRGRFELVVARSFARPAVTAECAAPLLAVGGVLRVSEPPEGDDRWPPEALARLGLVREHTTREPARIVELRQERACPQPFPRRVGVPAKRPLW
ncbi:MAG: class I SAM-dependent methyltransferase [Actinomycetota bacterium]|nr:class I SAM-dependent methyltransferase [Actinomycetota bacterium]